MYCCIIHAFTCQTDLAIDICSYVYRRLSYIARDTLSRYVKIIILSKDPCPRRVRGTHLILIYELTLEVIRVPWEIVTPVLELSQAIAHAVRLQ